VADEVNGLTIQLRQPCADQVDGVNGGDIKIAIFKQREGRGTPRLRVQGCAWWRR
jgi:hypothetical protein